ncbi:MAG: carboxymuconolactone decarboxylase family protein [Dehalococcoidia bacterium]
MARVSYVEKEGAPPEVREIFERMESRGARVLNLYKVVAHSRGVLRSFVRLGNALLQHAQLDPRLRELAILRIATVTGSEYEWSQHLPFAREVGVSQEQIEDIGDWQRSRHFDHGDRAVLRYVDEVAQRVKVSDRVFADLRQHLDEVSIVELTLSIGFWGMVARLLVPLGVEVEEELPASSAELLGRSGG